MGIVAAVAPWSFASHCLVAETIDATIGASQTKPDQADWMAANALGCFENLKEHGHAMCILASYPVGRVRGFKVDESGAVRW